MQIVSHDLRFKSLTVEEVNLYLQGTQQTVDMCLGPKYFTSVYFCPIHQKEKTFLQVLSFMEGGNKKEGLLSTFSNLLKLPPSQWTAPPERPSSRAQTVSLVYRQLFWIFNLFYKDNWILQALPFSYTVLCLLLFFLNFILVLRILEYFFKDWKSCWAGISL